MEGGGTVLTTSQPQSPASPRLCLPGHAALPPRHQLLAAPHQPAQAQLQPPPPRRRGLFPPEPGPEQQQRRPATLLPIQLLQSRQGTAVCLARPGGLARPRGRAREQDGGRRPGAAEGLLGEDLGQGAGTAGEPGGERRRASSRGCVWCSRPSLWYTSYTPFCSLTTLCSASRFHFHSSHPAPSIFQPDRKTSPCGHDAENRYYRTNILLCVALFSRVHPDLGRRIRRATEKQAEELELNKIGAQLENLALPFQPRSRRTALDKNEDLSCSLDPCFPNAGLISAKNGDKKNVFDF